VPDRLSDSVTLSTFHGCPAEEIDAIGRFLLAERGLHTVVKLNPTLLGYEEVEEILHGRLGYRHRVRRGAFEKDLHWDGALSIARDLSAESARRGLGFGFKVTNTLVVANAGDFMPGDEAYLSGEPLHVLALALGVKLREELGADLPLSFSAGLDAANVGRRRRERIRSGDELHGPPASGRLPAAPPAGRVPRGGDGRGGRRDAAGLRPRARAGLPGDLAEASLANLRRAAAEALGNPRYAAGHTGKPPRKIGSHLHLFDCINCDKCVPVCPNDANFTYETAPRTVVYRDLVVEGGRLVPGEERTLSLGGGKASWHQIASWSDACNDCGNCDVFCPEDGGPYVEKPRLFSSLASFVADAPRPGFFVRREADGSHVARGRWGGRDVDLVVSPGGSAVFRDGVAELAFASAGAAAPSEARLLTSAAREGHVVPVGHYHALRALTDGLFAPGAVSWLTATFPESAGLETSR
jgi:putative selenate reductase